MERPRAVLAMVWLVSVAVCSKASAPTEHALLHEPAATNAAGAAPVATILARTAPPSTMPDLGRIERRIIRNADIGIEAADPSDAQRAAVAIIEELGGYAASSERSSRADNDEPPPPAVSMVLRVPSEHFTVAIDRLEKLGSRVLERRSSSDDVTEEFIDLKARIVAQRALEKQFLEILEQAKSVKDALEVNTHLADVRTTIEKLEGRQRWLENQTSISTIKLRIAHSIPFVRAGSFPSGTASSAQGRSEERRVGKECTEQCRSRWSPYH